METDHKGGATRRGLPTAVLFVVGLALLVLPLAIILHQPGAYPLSAFYLRVIAALGGALVGSALPGLLDIRLSGVKAIGAMGLFIIIYLANPPGLAYEHTVARHKALELGAEGVAAALVRPGCQSTALVWSPEGDVPNRVQYCRALGHDGYYNPKEGASSGFQGFCYSGEHKACVAMIEKILGSNAPSAKPDPD